MRLGHFAFAALFALTSALPACVQAEPLEGEETSAAALADDGQDDSQIEGLGEPEVTDAELAAARRRTTGFVEIPAMTAEERAAILALYEHIPHAGIRQRLYENAVLYYHVNLKRIPNKRWLAVLDFALHSKHRRYYLMDMEGGPMVSHVVSHGKKSDPNDDGLATIFSNVNGSNMSSVGYYLTGETYIGANGRSLKLDGLSTTNSNARERYIVIHGADYVAEGRAKQGLSLGCPAFSHRIMQPMIDLIKDGSLMYAMN